MQIHDKGRPRVQAPLEAQAALLGALLTSLEASKKGRRHLERMLHTLEAEIDRLTIAPLHGPRVSASNLEGMRVASSCLRTILSGQPQTGRRS